MALQISEKKVRDYEEVEANKMRVLELCKQAPTRSEIVHETGLTKAQVQHIINALVHCGSIKGKSSLKVCRIIKRKMKRFELTGVPYVRMSYTKIAEERKKQKQRIKDLPPEEQQKLKLEAELRRKLESGKNTVIKINEHTTVYMNSKKPAGAYTWQSKMGARGGVKTGLQSGMAMFGNW